MRVQWRLHYIFEGLIMNIITGDILSVDTGIILQQVNAQGVMGSGVALALRKAYPEIWTDYSKLIYPHVNDTESAKHLGKVIITSIQSKPNLFIASIVAQQFYGRQGELSNIRYTSYDALDVALAELHNGLQEAGLSPPLIGSDRGGAHWPVVEEIIKFRLAKYELTLWVLPSNR
jgi:O-acetyl-ADP-ribose deacetylase (regulator of RNase III)